MNTIKAIDKIRFGGWKKSRIISLLEMRQTKRKKHIPFKCLKTLNSIVERNYIEQNNNINNESF